MRRRSKAYTRSPLGGRVTFYGDLTLVSAYNAANAAVGAVRDAVLKAVPEASVVINEAPESFMVSAWIQADDLAVINNGPMHRKAANDLRRAMRVAMDEILWLESEKITENRVKQ